MANRGTTTISTLTTVSCLLAFVTATGCGSGGDEGTTPVTVTFTRTPSPTDDPSASSVAAAPVSSRPVVVPATDRAFDAGLVAASRTQDDTLVLAIDRLTVAGIDDATLAATGALVEPDPGDRFGNQRVALYEVGVSPDAVFVVTTCTRGAEGVAVESAPVTAEEFLATVSLDTPVIFQYTAGVVSRAEVNPRC